MPQEVMVFALAGGAIALPIAVVLFFWYAAALGSLFAHLGGERWRGWVPVVGDAELLRRGGFEPWMVALFFIPLVNIYALVIRTIACHRVGRRLGMGSGMTVLALLFPPVWATIAAGRAARPESARTPASRASRERGGMSPGLEDTGGDTGATGGTSRSRSPKKIRVARTSGGYTVPGAPALPSMPAITPHARGGGDAPQAVLPTMAVNAAPDVLVAQGWGVPATDQQLHVSAQGSAAAPDVAVPEAVDAPLPSAPTSRREMNAQAPATVGGPGPSAPSGGLSELPPGVSGVPLSAPVQPPQQVPAPVAAPLPQQMLAPDTDDTMMATALGIPASVRVAYELLIDERIAFELRADRVVVGRAPSGLEAGVQPIAVPDNSRTLSKRHAELRRAGELWFIEDLGSTNGTIAADVGGAPQRLVAGHRQPVAGMFALGDVRMRIRAIGQP